MPPLRLLLAALALAVFTAPALLRGDIILPKIIGDNMVLQRGVPVPLWGSAGSDENITVSFAGQQKSTQVDASGHWQVILDPLTASSTPEVMTIAESGPAANISSAGKPVPIVEKSSVHVVNILVGEVWLCGGQSNMEYAVDRAVAGAPAATKSDPALAAEIKSDTYPLIRLFRVQKKLAPPDVVSDGWTECSGDNLAFFSAVGFFFARDLSHALNVPVGVIQSAWGGSRIEPWTPADAYAPLPAFHSNTSVSPVVIDGALPGNYFKAMVRPLAPFALRGVLWYQGESNIIATNDGVRYADKMQALVDGWRAAWHDPALPFYSVQLAPYYYTKRKDHLPHGPDELPKLWEAQYLALALPHTGLVPSLDLDSHFSNIHPNGKRIIGQRLTDLALTDTYGQPGLVFDGPAFVQMEISGHTAVLHFTNLAGGLASRDQQPLTEFEIAGTDGNFVPATAVIQGDTVVVSNPQVPQPAAVRFGWRETAQPNLINKAGLPAYPFRTNGPSWQPAPTP
jgi:sialate O-acetylesterase